jgi:hypothetical protein
MIADLDLSDLQNFTAVPEGKMPLFGDCFDDLPAEEKQRCCKVYTIDGRDYILTCAA